MFNFDEIMQVFSEELRKAEIAFADVSLTKYKTALDEISKPWGKFPSADIIRDIGLEGKYQTRSIIKAALDSFIQKAESQEQISKSAEKKSLAEETRYPIVNEYIERLEKPLRDKELQKKVKDHEEGLKLLKELPEDPSNPKTTKIRDNYKSLLMDSEDYNQYLANKKFISDFKHKPPYEQNRLVLQAQNEQNMQLRRPKVIEQNDQTIKKIKENLALVKARIAGLPPGPEKERLIRVQNSREAWLDEKARAVSEIPENNDGLVDILADTAFDTKAALRDMNKEDAWEKAAGLDEIKLIQRLSELKSSKNPQDINLAEAVESQVQQKPGESPKDFAVRLGGLMGQTTVPYLRLKELEQATLKAEVKSLGKEAFKKELAELSPTDRVDVLLDVAKTPEGKRMGATAMLKKELESSFGKDVADNLTNYMYSTKKEGQISESKLLSVVHRLERAKDQLDNTDWKDSKHKGSILLEVASNPMFGDKIVDKYKNYKPESEEEANKYFAQAGKAAQSKLDLDLLTERQRSQEGSKIYDPDLINQIAKKREELKGFEKELKGDTSELDKLGSKATNLSRAIQTMQTSIAQDMQSKDKRMSPIKLEKLRNSVFESKRELANIKKEMEPLAKSVLEDQKWLPPSEQNQYARAVIQAAPAKEPTKVVSTEPVPSKTPEEIQSEKEENKPIVAKLKETWLDKIKSEPTFIQDKIKSKLASIGDLSNDEFQMAQQNLQEIVSERIPLPVKNVAQVEGLPEMAPETSTAAQLAKSVEAGPESISGEAVPEPQLATQAPEGEVAPEEQAPVQTADNKTLEETQAKANQIVELNKQLASLTEALSTAVDEKAKRDLATQIAAIEQQLNNLKGV